MRVALTTEEMIRFGSIGLGRCADSLERRRVGSHGFDRNHERWQIDVEGCLTEAAAAKALGIPYEPYDGIDTDIGDIGPGLQVRGTKYAKGCLLIHPKDNDDHRFILVTGIYGVYDVRGWIHARDGKDEKFWRAVGNRPPTFWVEQDALQPIETLKLGGPA